ncbi:MAG: CoB--CoM heterodisulfide reductase iron-sulfur subunit A family protein [Actinomycetota bacterium]|nr:CoB--CoM heterodisulfide reductase iron-sulfur subunit A family protein [Actinomycetota bacterium]
MSRVGVFICHCGANIAGKVDVAKVSDDAINIPGVVYSSHQKYSCSEAGQKVIIDAIKENHIDKVVIGSCSPKMHENTFRKTIEQAGLNPYMLEIANLREHVSWVTADKDSATRKAFDLVKAAVGKVSFAKPLTPGQVTVEKRALVIGGGIAGIQAALDIANMGYEVVMVEKEPSIGGRMAQLDKTFPTLDCSACILSPRMVDVAQHPNIRLLTYSEVENVNGYVGNFNVTIRKKAKFVDESICTGCLECVTKCPLKKKIPNEFENGKAPRGAIYVPFAQAVPKVPVIDKEHCQWLLSPDPDTIEVAEGEKKPKRKCGVCQKKCEQGAINFEMEDELINEKFGAIVLATGFNLFDQKKYGEYGAGEIPDVITGLDFERMVNSSGPTEGKIVRPSNGEKPKKVAFIQCVGSRDEAKGVPYCSRICCMYTAKQAILVREKLPDAEVYVFYMDIRAAGKGYEEFVLRAQREYGANYVRGRVSRIYEQDGHLVLKAADTILGMPLEMEADMVILATGSIAREDSVALANTIGITTDAYGFISEVHPKLKPVEVPREGVFACGAALSPRDIPDTVATAGAVAAKVGVLFSNDILMSDPMVANIDPMICVACGACVEVCPYSAITMEEFRGKKFAKVNEAMCQGCGTCSAACRPGAAQLRGQTDEQILKSIEAVLQW